MDDRLKAIIERHADRLTALPNVVGVGVEADESGGGDVVAVYVEKKVPLAQMEPAAVVPKTLAATVDGKRIEAATRVIEVGSITR